MRRGIATVCLSGALEDKLTAAAAAGFDEVELFEPDLVVSPLAPEEVRRRAAGLGLEIGLYQPFRDFEAVPEERLRANLRRAERKFAVMERLGADLLLVCSNVADAAIDDDDLAAAQLRLLAERAAEHGIRIAYEALAWGRHVRDYDHAWRIARAADHPALGVCLDSFHILSRGADPRGIRDIPAEKIFYLQLADAPRLVMDVLQWSRHYRCFPGQGGFDLPAFLGHVLATGYAGPLSLEVFNDVFRQADPRRMAVDAMRSLLLLEEAVGATGLPAAVQPERLRVRRARGRAAGRVGPRAPADRAGFRQAGHHRTKAVQLWRRGRPTSWSTTSIPGARPRVAAIAVESADPIRSAETRRAAARPAAAARARAGRGGPVGHRGARRHVRVLLPYRRHGHRGLALRLRARRPAGPGATAEVAGIDHVALSQPFDYFDEAALFYRSVLGLELHAGVELAAPEGLVRSRAARSADGSVRFALNVPVVGSGGSAELQHVALACGDIFAAAARHARPRRAAARRACQLLRRPRRPHRPRAGDDRPPARARRPLRRGGRRRVPPLLHRDAGPEPLLRGRRAPRRLRRVRRARLPRCAWPRSAGATRRTRRPGRRARAA